ncbi:unnamed protein product [Anisakis simplex]|uniref:Uncharacterized protein n=1 Tax=Anisakis simplex TaxID=6269 RepID=A0A0M3K6J0_ANISI|nr:unnamed protein product [Anisakis simplex]
MVNPRTILTPMFSFNLPFFQSTNPDFFPNSFLNLKGLVSVRQISAFISPKMDDLELLKMP